MATLVLTSKNAAEVMRMCDTVKGLVASNYQDSRAVQTLSVTDASPMVVTHTKEGVTTTVSI